jgi:outer membrane protein OmpA-like peptidoglycan-associated protein
MKARHALAGALIALALCAAGSDAAQAQEWLLNAAASRFYMQTAKAQKIIETHQFTGLDGKIGKDGDANVKIDLTSIASGIDVRDVRMRFLLFETYKFPHAEITAKLDMAKLQELKTTIRISYPLKFTLNLHGTTNDIETPVFVTRLDDKSVSVSTAKPIIVTAESFGLTAGIAKLMEAINGTPIVSAASFTFDLVFETGDRLPALTAAQEEAARRKEQEETRKISAEECQTRFSVISTTGAIYFKTGSAELDSASEPLLTSVADIANRCPSVRIEVTGHTDSRGSAAANRQLSEQRARSVVAFLVQHGVAAERITAAGFGDTRPVAPNDTEANRAKNRRIEFRIIA